MCTTRLVNVYMPPALVDFSVGIHMEEFKSKLLML